MDLKPNTALITPSKLEQDASRQTFITLSYDASGFD
jgi:hypothetical protein